MRRRRGDRGDSRAGRTSWNARATSSAWRTGRTGTQKGCCGAGPQRTLHYSGRSGAEVLSKRPKRPQAQNDARKMHRWTDLIAISISHSSTHPSKRIRVRVYHRAVGVAPRVAVGEQRSDRDTTTRSAALSLGCQSLERLSDWSMLALLLTGVVDRFDVLFCEFLAMTRLPRQWIVLWVRTPLREGQLPDGRTDDSLFANLQSGHTRALGKRSFRVESWEPSILELLSV